MSALNFVIPQQPKHDGGNDGRISAQKFVVCHTKRKTEPHRKLYYPTDHSYSKALTVQKSIELTQGGYRRQGRYRRH